MSTTTKIKLGILAGVIVLFLVMTWPGQALATIGVSLFLFPAIGLLILAVKCHAEITPHRLVMVIGVAIVGIVIAAFLSYQAFLIFTL